MNIQYENQDEQTLIGSIRNYPEIQMKQIKRKNEQPVQPVTRTSDKQIVHLVQYGDTLEGLSLTYDVSIYDLKQRNKIESDHIYYLKSIIIPNPLIENAVTKQHEQFLKVEEFMMHMSPFERECKAARYYLSENDWDVKKAVKQYRQDVDWERNNNIRFITNPIALQSPIDQIKQKFQKKKN